VEHRRVPEKAQFGPDQLEVAADRIALAAILDARGRYREAELILRDVRSVLEGVLGRDHYEVAAAVDKLAAVVERRGDHAEAVSLYERSFAIKRRILGAGHANVAETLCDLGAALLAAGRIDDADLALREALPVLERLAHPRLARCRADLEQIRRRQ
jgi:tetratricopeptide (TPR) repeat protein